MRGGDGLAWTATMILRHADIPTANERSCGAGRVCRPTWTTGSYALGTGSERRSHPARSGSLRRQLGWRPPKRGWDALGDDRRGRRDGGRLIRRDTRCRLNTYFAREREPRAGSAGGAQAGAGRGTPIFSSLRYLFPLRAGTPGGAYGTMRSGNRSANPVEEAVVADEGTRPEDGPNLATEAVLLDRKRNAGRTAPPSNSGSQFDDAPHRVMR